MPSKAIYCDRYTYHYTYRITNVKNGMKYIGVHSCNCLPEEDIGVKYFSSSTDKNFLKEQKEYPDRFVYEVITIWNTRREALLHERFLLLTPNAARSPVYYNRHNGGINFNSKGRVTVKDKAGNTMQVSVDDPRYLSGELVHMSKGKITVKDENENFFQVSVNDPRYLSGELVHNMTGRIVVKNKDGNIMSVQKSDPRYLSGELFHISTGKTVVKDKDGNIYSISKNDPRYISGELVAIWKGKSHKSSTKYKIGKASRERMKNPKNNPQHGMRWIYNLSLLENRKIKKTDCTPDGWSNGRVLDWDKKINEILAKKEKILEKENYDKSRQKLAEQLWDKFLLKEYKSIRQFAKNEYDKSFVSLMELWRKYIPEYHKIIIPRKIRLDSLP